MMAQEHVSFPTEDGGTVYADEYGKGTHAIVLAHGMKFNKESWRKQAETLAGAGYRALAIDFRGYGQSTGGSKSDSSQADMYLDVLAAIRYLHAHAVTKVSVIGGSMGGGASAKAATRIKPGEIDKLILLAPVPVDDPEHIQGRKLFICSRGDFLFDRVQKEYAAAHEPKELVVLEGSAHAQNLFATDQADRVMSEILKFLAAP
jgi:pimeloyl-ACP methyl ester carboxylesterase